MTTGVTPIKYTWRAGFVTSIDPTIAAREFDRLAKRDGEVVPATLVEESRTPDSPLHTYFEWDDSVAGAQFRINQARDSIRALSVIFVRNDTEEPLAPLRAYVSVSGDVDEPAQTITSPRHYRPIVNVMSNEDLRDQYRRQAFDTLCSWRDRYRDIEDFARIFQEIEALKTRFDKAA